MNRTDFYFELPAHLIAQAPSEIRGEDRLLVMNKNDGSFKDELFSSLPCLLPKNALLVFNNSKVRHARVYATQISRSEENEDRDNKKSIDKNVQNQNNQSATSLFPTKENKNDCGCNLEMGDKREGAIEFLFIKTIDEGKRWKVLSPKMKRLKAGDRFLFANDFVATLIQDANTAEKVLCFDAPLTEDFFEVLGHVPLPPYIKREDKKEDASRYQTIYASSIGSIAAPTAGLHFTDNILHELKERGIELCYLTLHVGLGTFLPVREDKIEDHKMHTEEFFISEDVATKITEAKNDGSPIIACGTTSVRTLEAAWDDKNKCLKAGKTATNIFIYPPYHFNVVDGIVTNFHTPESTLLMLVSAFCGRQEILKAYRHAVEEEYKFFSYGDAMLIL